MRFGWVAIGAGVVADISGLAATGGKRRPYHLLYCRPGLRTNRHLLVLVVVLLLTRGSSRTKDEDEDEDDPVGSWKGPPFFQAALRVRLLRHSRRRLSPLAQPFEQSGNFGSGLSQLQLVHRGQLLEHGLS